MLYLNAVVSLGSLQCVCDCVLCLLERYKPLDTNSETALCWRLTNFMIYAVPIHYICLILAELVLQAMLPTVEAHNRFSEHESSHGTLSAFKRATFYLHKHERSYIEVSQLQHIIRLRF